MKIAVSKGGTKITYENTQRKPLMEGLCFKFTPGSSPPLRRKRARS
jgi:hypothetical protein